MVYVYTAAHNRRHRWEGEVEREVVLLHVIAVPRSDHLWIFKQFHSMSPCLLVSPVLTAVLAQKLVFFSVHRRQLVDN